MKRKTHTPLDGLEDGSLEGFGEAGVQCARFLLFTGHCLEEVEATLAGNLTLKLFLTIKRHAGDIGLGDPMRTRGRGE